MARTRKQRQLKAVETLTHEGENRKNIPTAEYQPVMRDEELNPMYRLPTNGEIEISTRNSSGGARTSRTGRI